MGTRVNGLAGRSIRLGSRVVLPAAGRHFLTSPQVLLGALPALVRLGTQKSSTSAVGDLIQRTHRQSNAMREAVTRRFGKRNEVRRAFGVGASNRSATLGAALSAADAVLTGATQFPTETANAGILPRDIAELQKLRDDLIQTDRNQEGAKGERTGGTASKNSLLGGLTSQVDQIFAAAALEFAHEPLTVSLPG